MRKPLERYLGLEHPALLVAEPEGGYTALHPDLKGCVAVGETPEAALARWERRLRGEIGALEGLLRALEAGGQERLTQDRPLSG
jgi:predicted RNase H-like HicB family nuclease